MTKMQVLYKLVDDLNAEERQQLFDYLIVSKPKTMLTNSLIQRKAGLGLDAVWRSDDLDDELGDSSWLGVA